MSLNKQKALWVYFQLITRLHEKSLKFENTFFVVVC